MSVTILGQTRRVQYKTCANEVGRLYPLDVPSFALLGAHNFLKVAHEPEGALGACLSLKKS